MIDLVFIRLDGDNIGDAIELALMNTEFDKAQEIHNRVQHGIQFLSKLISAKATVNLLLVGADDILFTISRENYEESYLHELEIEFFEKTGFTLSIGVGRSLVETLYNLKRAKLSGRNRIVSTLN